MTDLKYIALVALLGLSLGGCQAAGQAVAYAEGNVDDAIRLKQKQSNVEARAILNVPCAMTIGAYHRELSAREQAAVAELCGGGQPSPALTGE